MRKHVILSKHNFVTGSYYYITDRVIRLKKYIASITLLCSNASSGGVWREKKMGLPQGAT